MNLALGCFRLIAALMSICSTGSDAPCAGCRDGPRHHGSAGQDFDCCRLRRHSRSDGPRRCDKFCAREPDWRIFAKPFRCMNRGAHRMPTAWIRNRYGIGLTGTLRPAKAGNCSSTFSPATSRPQRNPYRCSTRCMCSTRGAVLQGYSQRNPARCGSRVAHNRFHWPWRNISASVCDWVQRCVASRKLAWATRS